jgi:hypothetical protein
MAKVRGNDGVVKVGANTVASVNRFTLDETMEPIDDTDLGTQAKEFAAGDTSWTAEIECKWDKADSTGQGAMTIGTSVTIALQPEGDTTGDERRTGTALIAARGAVSEKGSMVMQSFSLQGTGVLTVDSVP